MSGFEVAGIEKFGVFAHVPVDVISLNETAKRDGVCEDKCAIHHIWASGDHNEMIHDQFRYFKYRKAEGDWLV